MAGGCYRLKKSIFLNRKIRKIFNFFLPRAMPGSSAIFLYFRVHLYEGMMNVKLNWDK